MNRLNEDAALLIQLHKAEARVKELEREREKDGMDFGAQVDRAIKAEARVKELEEANLAKLQQIKSDGDIIEHLKARVKELEEKLEILTSECDWLDDILATPWRGKSVADKLFEAEARVKELEEEIDRKGNALIEEIAAVANARDRMKELEAERDDLLRLGNNHK